MNILYHHRTLGDGAEGIHIAEIVKALRRQGHNIKVVSLIGESTNRSNHRQRTWTRLAKLFPGFVYEIAEMTYNIKGYREIKAVVREFRPDFIYDRYASFNYSCVAVARQAHLPLLLEVNSPYSFQKKAYEKLYFKKLLKIIETKTCRDASCVLVVSTPLKEYLVNNGVPKEKIEVIPNGADPEVFHPSVDGNSVRAKYGIQDRCIIGFVGILRPWHGLELLLEVFSKLEHERKNLHLLIIGNGPSEKDLISLSQKMGIAHRTTFTGRVSHEEMRSYIAALDIAVSPRATFYASPMKILEYMAIALPVIAPNMANIRDIVENGKDGLLFDPENKDSLRDMLNRVDGDQELRKKIGLNARKKIEQSYTWESNAHRIVEIAKKIIK